MEIGDVLQIKQTYLFNKDLVYVNCCHCPYCYYYYYCDVALLATTKMSFQGGQLRPFVRRDRTAECNLLLPSTSDSEPNVIVRQFTLQKGKFRSESEAKTALVVAPALQVHNDDRRKSFESSETKPSNPNQRFISIQKFDTSQFTVERREIQETTKDVAAESNSSKVRTIAGPQVTKTVPLILAKGTRLGMVGSKLVMLQPMTGTQQVRELGQTILTKHSGSVYKKVNLTSDDSSRNEADSKNSSSGSSGAEASVVKPSVSSGEVLKNKTPVTTDTKKLHTISPTAPKQVNTEAVLANPVKESPGISCQLKLETSSSSSKGCYILPFTSMNHSNNGEVVKLSTSAQNEAKVINTNGNHMLSSSAQNEVKIINAVGNQMQPILVKPSIEGKANTSAVTTLAEPVLTSSPQKKTVVFTTGLKTGQPILKFADIPGNSAGAKSFMLSTNKNSGEKTNGNIRYVALPGHVMLPKLLPGTKVYTTAALSQKNVAVTGVSALVSDNKVVAAPPTVAETNTVSTAATVATAPVQQLNVPKIPPVTPNQTSANKIELKVEVDQKGDVVGVTPKTQLVNEQLDKEKVKATVHGSWALLQKRCNQAMELKKKVLQKEKYQSRIRKIPQRTITEIDRGTQTSFFSLVEPGRLVEIQLEEENLNEGENVKENSTAKSTENMISQGVNMSSEVNSTGNIYDDTEPPQRKKIKTGKPMTVYDVLVQHNIQAMAEKPVLQNSEQSLVHKVPKRQISAPAPPSVEPSCSSPAVSNPEVSAQLNSTDNSKLKTPEMQRQLLEDFVQCVQRDNCGNIRLHTAVYYEQAQLVKRHCALLNARKASLDVHNDDMETPLHMAVMLRNVEIIRILLGFGAKVSVTDGSGNTALHLAVLEGNEQVLNVLLNHSTGDLPLNTFNDEGLAPLHLCAQAGKIEEAKALLHKGAEIDLKDAKSGRTPLFHAVERNAVKLVKMFLDLGANANLPNFSGHTPLLAANEYCDLPNPPITNDSLCTTPKLRPVRADDGPMVAALVGLSTDLGSQMFVENKQTSQVEQR